MDSSCLSNLDLGPGRLQRETVKPVDELITERSFCSESLRDPATDPSFTGQGRGTPIVVV
jgi:hypothetical protein